MKFFVLLIAAFFLPQLLGVFAFPLVIILALLFYPRSMILYAGLATVAYYLPDSVVKDIITALVLIPLLPLLMADD